MPFSLNERVKRINQVRATLSDPRVTASEQVRQVLEAYNIEREYGRTIETYEDSIVLDGEEKVVNILRIWEDLHFYINLKIKVKQAFGTLTAIHGKR
ncbi:MAG: hypothetical protein CM15mP127_10750 [Gammaproteobacteria bacterium]|nr:MAG: hypothetical protein CM15mP127_10750 [Gammaproteobacteria bacterium]